MLKCSRKIINEYWFLYSLPKPGFECARLFIPFRSVHSFLFFALATCGTIFAFDWFSNWRLSYRIIHELSKFQMRMNSNMFLTEVSQNKQTEDWLFSPVWEVFGNDYFNSWSYFPLPETVDQAQTSCVAEQNRWWLAHYISGVSPRLRSQKWRYRIPLSPSI